ncbi:MAG: thioredoxin domain-containing protein [Comamonadaceae bacterium]
MSRRKLVVAAAVLLILALGLAGLVYKFQNDERTAQAAQSQAALVRSHSPIFGNADAPVHIVEFLDPACGTCADFYPFVKDLMAAHPGKIKVSVRYAPFHRGSDQVVKVLEAARKQGQFKQVLEALFAAQSVWVQNHVAQVDLIWGLLGNLGLDMDRLRADMNSPETLQVVQQDLADANMLGVAMTPEFFVNGKPLPKFGYEDLRKLVDEALASAKTS